MKSSPKLILASKSAARQSMMKNAGLSFECVPSDVDEVSIVESMLNEGFHAPGIALVLAKEKAMDVSRAHPDALVIGSDQTLDFQGQLLSKSENVELARQKLSMMRGADHSLVSAVSVVQGGQLLWQHIDDAYLTMRDFDDEFLDLYCQKAGDALTKCVGGYEFEGYGSWLFSSIKGDFYTILGMPLLPLLGYLLEKHGVKP